MATELARVSLWLEALEPGKPLSYLDENIRVGNSLLGIAPALLADGLPDEAFKPIEGDDRKVAAALKKQNAAERQGQHDLFRPAGIPVTNATLAKRAAEVARVLPESLEDLHIQQQRQAAELAESPERRTQKLLADAWCAAFVQPKTDETRATAITQATLEQFSAGSTTLDLAAAEDLVAEMTRRHRFFHWHVEFPHIFRVGNGATDIDPATGWSGGFSCVIGNPPWERVKLQEREFFAARSPAIANSPNAAARKKLIAALPDSGNVANRTLYQEFQAELRRAAGWSHLLRESGRYPLTGRGDINTYAVFAETARMIIGPRGRSGLVLPTGIATDATTAPFFSDLARRGRVVHVFGFRNNRGIFKNVGHGDVRFCLFAFAGGGARIRESRFAFELGLPNEIADPLRVYTLEPSDIMLVNPNTGNCPAFHSTRDAQILIGIYKRIPVFWRHDPDHNPWKLSFLSMFHMANDSGLFHMRDELEIDGWQLAGNVFTQGLKRMLPLYEGKMFYLFDHRYGDFRQRQEGRVDSVLPRVPIQDKVNPSFHVLPRYWVDEAEVTGRLSRRSWDRHWFLGWRRISNNTNERTMISAIMPRNATGDSLFLQLAGTYPNESAALAASISSFVLDFVTRQKLAGQNLNYFLVEQLPVIPPETYRASVPWLDGTPTDWIAWRVLELCYTAWDMEGFARDLGDQGPPFQWDEERRFRLRAELDAVFFHLYGIERDDVDYIMESFDTFRKNDRAWFDRTKDLILQVYDAMAEAIRTGEPYQTILDPPPGRGPRHG
jgi:hypothetical protein